jgi:hypothetical protein
VSWVGLLLVGLGISDLVFSVLPSSRVRGRVAEGVGALSVVLLGLLAGLTGVDVVGVLVLAVVVLVCGESVTHGFARRRYRLTLAVLGVAVAGVLLASGAAPDAGGRLGDWLDATAVPLLSGVDPDRALVVLGVLLVQLSTGNVVVRLVLGATGTGHPLRSTSGQATAGALKGGRILGPLERLFILGLGLAGEVTAASIVIAAKGLLRFPELQAARADGTPGPGIHEVTEYFLVGSFVSWSVSLGCLALVAA